MENNNGITRLVQLEQTKAAYETWFITHNERSLFWMTNKQHYWDIIEEIEILKNSAEVTKS